MNEKERRKVSIKKVANATSLGQITKEELLAESQKYDPENYNPLSDIDDKEIIVPDNRADVITIRVTRKENDLLAKLASNNGISKSAFLRSIVLKAIKDTSSDEIEEIKRSLNSLSERMEKLESHTT